MTSAKQVEANRANSQSSTGPTTEAGKKRSSLNATRHGFTGQSLLLTDQEKEAYEFHVLAFMEQYSPASHQETELVQQYCDLTWSLHQIAVQQSNLMTLMNAVTTKFMAEGDIDGVVAAIAPFQKSLSALSIYETRKRRAADQVQHQLTALIEARQAALKQAAAISKAHKAQGKPWNPAEFGFACSQAEIDTFLRREAALSEGKKS